MIESLKYLFQRDLDRLKSEVIAYQSENDLWIIKGDIKNSTGNLCMHLIGNLNHFVGHVVGGNDYRRNREFEFSGKLPKSELIHSISETKKVIEVALSKLKQEELNEPFPIQLFDVEYSYSMMLIHLSGHLNYHLGQINYHRRIITS